MTNKFVEQFKKDVEKLLQENVSLSETKGKIITDMLVEGLIDCDDANKMLLDESIDLQEVNETKRILEICNERENDGESTIDEIFDRLRNS